MTRYKKYLKELGYKFSEDFPFIPYTLNGLTIEDHDVFVKYGEVLLVEVTTSLVCKAHLLRNGKVEILKPLSYEELMSLARKHYNDGGDGIYECWDINTYNDYVSQFGDITFDVAMSLITLTGG